MTQRLNNSMTQRLNDFINTAGVWMWISGVLWGCSGQEEVMMNEHITTDDSDLREVVLQLQPSEKVDSAQVFFFRTSGEKDTLIWHEVIYNMEYMVPHTFRFELPAGKYNMSIYGNVPTDRIVARPPYTQQDIYFDYSGGYEPGAVTHGMRILNIGVDSVSVSGMVFLSSFVELTIHKVPAEVRQIVVKLLNTSSGMLMAGGYLQEPTTPPLSHVLEQLQGDSTYITAFYCFPRTGKNERSTLEVNCLDAAGQTIWSGSSEPFEPRPGYYWNIACSFGGAGTKTTELPGELHFILRER